MLALLVSHRAKLWASTITHPCVCGRWGRCIVQRLCATAIVHPLHVYERSVGFASCETLGVHFIRHPCLTRKLRVLAPAAPKIIPRLLSGENCGWAGLSNCACSVGFASLRNLGQALSCILARPASCGFSHPPTHKKCNPTH